MKTRAVVFGVLLLAGCRAPAPPEPLVQATSTPAPALGAGDPTKTLADGRVEYHIVIRSEAGVAYLPIDLSLADPERADGIGMSSWVRRTSATWAYESEGDRYVVCDAKDGGQTQEEIFNVIFPASPQELKVAVRYKGEPPPQETLVLLYRELAIPDLGTKVYVLPKIGDAELARISREPRTALGARMRGVDVFRWLAGGFFLREPGPVLRTTITLDGAGARPTKVER